MRKAIEKLQSDDKNRDIDYNMDRQIQAIKDAHVDLHLEGSDFDDSGADTPNTEEAKHLLKSERPKSADKIEVPKSREKCLAILVEAV